MSTPSSLSDQPRRRTTTSAPTTNGDLKDTHEVHKFQENDPTSNHPGQRVSSGSVFMTAILFSLWYLLTVIFNIANKKIYNYFPYPYFVSTTHLLVGAIYCMVSWWFSLPKRAPCDMTLLKLLIPVGVCHAVGHAMGNVSFANVPISFTQTIKVLEPFFNAAATQFILGQRIPLPLWLSLAPIVIGVTIASCTELSFNWLGFNGAMISNFTSTYRNIYLKKAMKDMDSTNLYSYTCIIALIFSLPMAAIIEGPQLIQHGFKDVIAKVGWEKISWDLLRVGICYHLFNQIGSNILERVTPLTHAVGNVSKRIAVIVSSIIIFGNKISTQTGWGTCIAISGIALYSFNKARMDGKKPHKKAA